MLCEITGINVNCSVPPDIENGTIQYMHNRTSVGDTANMTCNEGFNISDDSVITCQYDGTWSSPPVCHSIGRNQYKWYIKRGLNAFAKAQG